MKLYRSILLIVFLLSFLCSSQSLRSQQVTLENVRIGHPVPDFTLENVQYYRQKTVSSEDLKGKFVILCFWSRFCTGAFTNFSRMDDLAKRFKGRVEIIMVGGRGNQSEYDKNRELDSLEILFERTKKMQDLNLPISYDIDLFQHFVPYGVPHFIWIDDKGIVQAVTGNIDSTMAKTFLAREEFDFYDASMEGRQRSKQRQDAYDYKKPFLVNGNGGKSDSFQYRSLITPYTNDMPRGISLTRTVDLYENQGKLEGIAPLENLYKLAFFGYYMNYDWYSEENYNRLILNIKDKTPFSQYNYNIPIENMYWYSLIVPPHKRDPESLKHIMQQDLENYFGYRAKIEKLKLPYWSITAGRKIQKKLKAKGKQGKILGDWYTSIGAQDISIQKYIKSIFYIIALGSSNELPIIDETGLEGNIDIAIEDVDLSNFEDVKRVLQKQGFTVEMAYKKFNVLVISDPKSDTDKDSK